MFVLFGKRKCIIVFLCLCSVSMALSWLTARDTRQAATAGESLDGSVKHEFSVALAPVHFLSSLISAVWSKFASAGSVLTSMWQKPVEKAELEMLKTKVGDLKRQLDEERKRNRRLAELYGVHDSLTEGDTPLKLMPAKVVAVEPTDWFRYLTIDKGESSGLEVDMTVVTRSDLDMDAKYLTGAVVGRISDVQARSARVQLITDRFSATAVTIESVGDLVRLNGRPETENCVIDEIPSTTYDILKEGQAVLVDERSSIFPAGMLVGRISSITKGTHFCRAEVRPAFRFGKLREVMVVLNN